MAFTRVAACVLAEPPKAALCHRSASTHVVTSMSRSDCFRLERQLAGRASHPLGASALARRTILKELKESPRDWEGGLGAGRPLTARCGGPGKQGGRSSGLRCAAPFATGCHPRPGTLAEAAPTARLAPRSGPVRGAPRATPPASARQCGNPRSIPHASSHGTVAEPSDLQPAATGRASLKIDNWHTACSIINPHHTIRWNSHPMAASAGNRPGEAGRALRRPPPAVPWR